MVTIKDVSELAGVSQATVSRVINGKCRVGTDKKLRVERAIKILGYRPNAIAQALASCRTGSIGIIVPELGGFFSGILNSMERLLRNLGYHVIVTTGSNTEQSEQESVEFMLNRRVDAIILHTQQLSDEYLIDLEKKGIYIVLINRIIPEIAESCINIDNVLGGLIATKHLINMGHKTIACITGPLEKADARERLEGYRQALNSSDIEYRDDLVVEASFTEESGARATEKLLGRNYEFSAIFASNDHMAFGASEVLKTKGYAIPEQISLIGFDDVIFARYLTPSLTTINFPVESMSEEAVQLVIQKIKKHDKNVNFKLSPSLVIRASVRNLKET
ncbi:LacI family transcriptional regulator [Vibrio albus]|uniref:LacI family transcriptional regulator n=1 Tax=Vibrio albus TaxID=2200953 RepID=A0A2U3B9E0_9VIBR|nr:LacI family DNA-binding transcriptional regulator [Vibrio albus]PWI33410.1 LacI family transcriptional regulator [Vibrio albus]